MKSEIKLALIGIALAVLLVGSHAAVEHFREQGRAEVHADWDADKLIRAQALQNLTNQLRQTEQGFTDQLAKAHNDFTEKSKQITVDADRARITVNSLRNDLAIARTRLPAPGADPEGTIAEYARAVTDVFEQCSERYRGVAEKADRHAADAEMMREAWPGEFISDIGR
jgi:hypothetical protein